MQHPDIKYIDTPAALGKTCDELRHKTEFAFDTEFDRFYREYGFKLSLLQIFDGDKCYLIDPLAMKDLQELWVLFEDPSICKVVYSCSEDIQILKVNGCNPKNIYDIQIAAKFCNYPTNSLGDLMRDVFGMEPDKSMQRSNWLRRPLLPEQITYAGNDVSKLLELKILLEKVAAERNVAGMIAEENRSSEKIPVTEFKVKLSHNHKRKYSHNDQKKFMELLVLRNEIAMEYNVPPATIVSDNTLENIMENKTFFLRAPFTKGFSKRLTEDEKNKSRFMDLIGKVKEDFILMKMPDREAPTEYSNREIKNELSDSEIKYLQLYTEITDQFGKDAGEHILRGFKKSLTANPQHPTTLKGYQENIINEACKKLGIDFSKLKNKQG